MNIVKKLFRRLLKSQTGFSLIETAGVIAITATLAAVVTPIAIDKIGDAKVQSAKEDCSQIKNAITSFYVGTGNYPAFSSSGTSTYYVALRSGAVAEYNTTLGIAAKDPVVSNVTGDSYGWGLAASSVDLMRNHLVYDNAGTNAEPSNSVHPYATAKITWKGPYIATTDKQDPWGHNYLAFVKGAYAARDGTDGKKNFGWILSAGPNGSIDTPVSALTPVGDDVGVVIGSKESGGYSSQ